MQPLSTDHPPGRLFDAFVAVDWSAGASPGSGPDSIWVACGLATTPELVIEHCENPTTREAASSLVRGILRGLVSRDMRVLVGFDFPYGYPGGLADRVAPGQAAPWSRAWGAIAEQITDSTDNRNNRFEVASRIDQVLGSVGPFLGLPAELRDGNA